MFPCHSPLPDAQFPYKALPDLLVIKDQYTIIPSYLHNFFDGRVGVTSLSSFFGIGGPA